MTFPVHTPLSAQFMHEAMLGRFTFACCLTDADFLTLHEWANELSQAEFETVLALCACQPGLGGLTVPPSNGNSTPGPQPVPGGPPQQYTCLERVATLICQPTVLDGLRSISRQLRPMEALPAPLIPANGSAVIRALRIAIDALVAGCELGSGHVATPLDELCRQMGSVRRFIQANTEPSTRAILNSVSQLMGLNPVTQTLLTCCDWSAQ